MGRVVGFLPIGEVAAGIAAIGGSDLQIVVAVDMALRTLHRGMRVGQRESRGAVIKGRVVPGGGVMAR